jgi:hypothetical protein
MLKMSGKYTIYFDIERPWTLKFNQIYTQLLCHSMFNFVLNNCLVNLKSAWCDKYKNKYPSVLCKSVSLVMCILLN